MASARFAKLSLEPPHNAPNNESGSGIRLSRESSGGFTVSVSQENEAVGSQQQLRHQSDEDDHLQMGFAKSR